jgi:transcriptional regulator with XRE-family HTH domain
MKPFSEQLRRAILESDKTRYAIAKETGIAQSTLSRFVNQGAGLSMESIDRLCECLNLTLKGR